LLSIVGEFSNLDSCRMMNYPAKRMYMPLKCISSLRIQLFVCSICRYYYRSNHFTLKSRAALLLKFHSLICDHAPELAKLIVSENGKNITEALADIAKGNETVEYACSLASLVPGKQMRVSSDVYCQDRRDPVGIVGSIVPFNFPFMVVSP